MTRARLNATHGGYVCEGDTHYLLNERSLILEEIGDLRVAAVNDRTIYACAEVVRQCAARMHETGERQ